MIIRTIRSKYPAAGHSLLWIADILAGIRRHTAGGQNSVLQGINKPLLCALGLSSALVIGSGGQAIASTPHVSCAAAFEVLYFQFLTQFGPTPERLVLSEFAGTETFKRCARSEVNEISSFTELLYLVAVADLVDYEISLDEIENPLWRMFFALILGESDGGDDGTAALIADLSTYRLAGERDRALLWWIYFESDSEIDSDVEEELRDSAIAWGLIPALEREITHEHYRENDQPYAVFQLRNLQVEAGRGAADYLLSRQLAMALSENRYLTVEQSRRLIQEIRDLAYEAARRGTRIAYHMAYVMNATPETECDLILSGLAQYIDWSADVNSYYCGGEEYVVQAVYSDFYQRAAQWVATIDQWSG